MRFPSRPAPRRGVAAVELAFVTMLFVVPLLLGIWEAGRLIHVQQIVANSAREGARLAGQGYTLKVNTDGSVSPVQIKVASGSPSVKDVVIQYLHSCGLSQLQDADVTVEFAFTTSRTTDYTLIAGLDPAGTSYPTGSTPTEPCYGEKGEIFTVHVSIPWDKVRWLNLGILKPTKVQFTVTWRMLVDDAFQVNSTLPTW